MLKIGLYQARYRLVDSGFNYIPPLSLGYLAAYARQRVEGVEFFAERNLERVIEQRPDLVGITYLTHSSRNATREARRLKEALGCPIIGGGLISPLSPRRCPRRWTWVSSGKGKPHLRISSPFTRRRDVSNRLHWPKCKGSATAMNRDKSA